MKETLEKLWADYLLEECAEMNSEEERKLTKKAAELHKKATALLNNEQQDAVEEYIHILCTIDSLFAKKAFFKGCEFTFSFISEAGN